MGLTDDQAEVVHRIVDLRRSMYVGGEAGSGKSFMISHVMECFQQQGRVAYVTATTGISAFHLRGMTVHSCLGLGIVTPSMTVNDVLRRVWKRRHVLDRIRSIQVLMIDEISMMSARLWEIIDEMMRVVRREKVPFGGCQMVVLGDFFQLLPVFTADDDDTRLVFESPVWKTLFHDTPGCTYWLYTNRRQANDPVFHRLLTQIRTGCSLVTLEIRTPPDHAVSRMTYLVPTRKRAHDLNCLSMARLPGAVHSYEAQFQGRDEDMIRDLRHQFQAMNLVTVHLKKGCRVMLVYNLDVPLGLVNGAMGVVHDMTEDHVMVRFDHRPTVDHAVAWTEWTLGEEGDASARQIPLVVAYAITIHKSQSLTLEMATMELAACFAPHQVYVALSRLTNAKGLYVQSFAPQKVFCDSRVMEYMSRWERMIPVPS